MADTHYETRQVRFGYKEQTAFATPEADDAAFEEVSVEPFNVDPDVLINELSVNHGSRYPVEQITAHSTKGSIGKFPVAGPVDLNDIDQFLYAHFQKVVELADTVFTKTFTHFSDHPSFHDDGGHFLTWIRRHPAASTSQKMGGCIAPRIKISGERNGFIKFESDWVSYGTPSDVSNPSGTWTPRDGSNLLYFNDILTATLTKGAGQSSPIAITMRSFDVESILEVEPVGFHTTFGFEDLALRSRNGSFSVNVLRDATADEALISLKAGELVQLDIDIGLMTISVIGKIESLEYDADGLLANTITCRMLAPYVAGTVTTPLTIVVENTIDRGWPAA